MWLCRWGFSFLFSLHLHEEKDEILKESGIVLALEFKYK